MKKINYLAIIPARKGSKRIKDKNLVKINNKELIKFTIEAAIKTKKIDKIIVSSDDDKILKIAKKFRTIAVKRPKKISGDTATTEQAILHSYNYFYKKKYTKVKNIILLQPTSPLRNEKHIKECINLFEKKKYNSIFSAYTKKEFMWKNKNKKIVSFYYNFKKRIRTQKMDELIFENGAIYIFSTKGFIKFNNRLFGKIGVYFMKKTESIDIDHKEDVEFLKRMKF